MPYDLLLVHPPSYLYFREEDRNYGPISDVIPSTPVFDMYPIGFLSLTSYLSRLGFKVAIKNVAARLILSKRYDYRKMLRKTDAIVIAIDLHWLVHAHGALELARIAKEEDPSKKVVLGGLSSTFFYKEIMSRYSWVDAVVLGDTVEPVMALLLERLSRRESFDDIPNIIYRRGDRIRFTGLRFIPKSLDSYRVDYDMIFKHMARSGDPLSFIPYAFFTRDPIAAVLSFKGCMYNCVTCGGSRFAYASFMGRRDLARKKPETIFEEIKSINDGFRIPIFIVGDLQVYGRKFIERLASLVKSEGVDVPVIFEFFVPPSRETVRILARSTPRVYFQISPESQDEHVRKMYGRPYSNSALKSFIENSLEHNVERLDLYFMIGLPGQDYWNAMGIPRYADLILSEYGSGHLDLFVAPLAPFVDPGSIVYVNPSSYGYVLRTRTLAGHAKLLERARDWRGMLNYETLWLTREELSRTTYDVARELLRVKVKHGLIDEGEAEKIVQRMKLSYEGDGDNISEKDTLSIRELYPHVASLSWVRRKSLLPLVMLSMLLNYLRYS